MLDLVARLCRCGAWTPARCRPLTWTAYVGKWWGTFDAAPLSLTTCCGGSASGRRSARTPRRTHWPRRPLGPVPLGAGQQLVAAWRVSTGTAGDGSGAGVGAAGVISCACASMSTDQTITAVVSCLFRGVLMGQDPAEPLPGLTAPGVTWNRSRASTVEHETWAARPAWRRIRTFLTSSCEMSTRHSGEPSADGRLEVRCAEVTVRLRLLRVRDELAELLGTHWLQQHRVNVRLVDRLHDPSADDDHAQVLGVLRVLA